MTQSMFRGLAECLRPVCCLSFLSFSPSLLPHPLHPCTSLLPSPLFAHSHLYTHTMNLLEKDNALSLARVTDHSRRSRTYASPNRRFFIFIFYLVLIIHRSPISFHPSRSSVMYSFASKTPSFSVTEADPGLVRPVQLVPLFTETALTHSALRLHLLIALIERAQFALNDCTYQPGVYEYDDGYKGSFLGYFLHEMEKVHCMFPLVNLPR